MSEFLSLLAVYYLCDATATLRPMEAFEIMACFDSYEAVKVYFAPAFELAPRGSPERIAQMQAAYLGFVEWEAANPDLVAAMEQDARLRAEAALAFAQ